MTTDNLKIIGSIHKSLKDIIPTQCKKDRKRNKTVGVKVNDVSESTTSIEETKLSDNSDNNAPIVAELVDHPNDVENIDFEAEFEHLMFADIEGADTMLGQHEKVPEYLFLSDDVQLDGVSVPPLPQPQPVEVATPVNHGLTYIWDMFDLDVL